MMTTKTTDRRMMPHPASMSYPHGVRPETECLHGVAARGGAGGSSLGKFRMEVYKIEAVSILGAFRRDFRNSPPPPPPSKSI
jgi:hypothetical protein